MHARMTRVFSAAAAIVTAGALLAGCSSGAQTASGDASSAGGDVAISVATYPVLSNAAAYIGESEGIFAENGLTPTFQTITAGAEAVPLLLKGDLTFAPVDVPTAVKAAQENVGVVAVASMMEGVDIDKGYVGVVAPANSGITDWKGLEGKKVAVNALGGSAVAQISASMEDVGADPSTVQWVELAQPQTIPAILAGQVDAANLAQPLLTAAELEGLVQVGNPEKLTVAGVPTFVYLATKQYVEQNPDAVKSFQAAIEAAGAAANGDHALVIETAKTSTTVDPALLDEVTGFPNWAEGPLTAADLQKYIDLMVTAGMIEQSKAPAASDVVSSLNQ
ncbi:MULTISPECIES: ABC transporter substrate-binding protein [Microbacterium]|uniref:ABC transporter substrate-binding protein n=1 Tax=Microbacterium TaxID=33882 RepID=UPI002787B601|nr:MULTISPECIES: ABC transporter substrate-binding protein [Microbacterium]MDQ1075146.1 NitT/TauT family transport system substrate-binding protein [Microbacterium sp. SORGH_AS_0969]MDQ1115377.1 NitT/TauT family transport system substrate-binding protein [Microbacterium testaceum]